MVVDMKHRPQIIAYSGTFFALIAAGSWISIPLPPVPITLQTLFVLLAGVVMKRYAVIPVGLYILLGAANLPIFHNGTAGVGVLLGPTGGYLLGFLPAAFIVGLAYERRSASNHLAGLVAGSTLIYVCGVGWLAYSASMPLLQAVLLGVLPFIIGDAVKIATAYTIGQRVS
jgi:biotin transport system substrate-specific component